MIITRQMQKQLTSNFHRTSWIDASAVGTYAIFFWCCRFNLKQNLFVRWILEAHVWGDRLCEWTWNEAKIAYLSYQLTFPSAIKCCAEEKSMILILTRETFFFLLCIAHNIWNAQCLKSAQHESLIGEPVISADPGSITFNLWSY